MTTLSRRQFVGALAAVPLAEGFPALLAQTVSGVSVDQHTRATIAAYLEHHRKEGGGYGWTSRTTAHVTPTFAVVGCYRLLELPVPNAEAVAAFAAAHYPVPPGLGQQPLCRLDYELAQVLLWLGQKPEDARAEKWTKPFVYSAYYEQGHNPTLQHQAMAVRVRKLLGLQTKDELSAWRDYFTGRRRANGTFNNTPAADGSGGHLINTLWATGALEDLGGEQKLEDATLEWVRSCQLPSGGFTWSPGATLGGVDNVIYTWAAVSLLKRAGSAPKDRTGCVRWLREQFVSEGGFRDRPGAKANLTATYYALDTLRLLHEPLRHESRHGPAIARTHLPSGLRIYSAQIEAPGNGSPTEAVGLAEALDIHLWTAKNTPPGWIAEAQRIADARGTSVQIARGDEEYGTYTRVAGFGMYSHLDDLVAPGTAELGPYPPEKNVGMDWTTFRDTRIRKVRGANGRMVWQFNENEELTRILLDQTVADHSYGAISGFHFGIGDFLEFEPFLMAWEGRIPMVGLQDAHGGESWWWAPQLEGFRTLYLASEPGWDGFVQAMDRQWILAVRRDATTQNQLQWTGALPEVREAIATRENEWSWWGANAQKRALPLAMLTVLRPGMKFEDGAPQEGMAVRLRLRFSGGKNPTRDLQEEPESELVSLQVDGKAVQPRSVVKPHDRYLIYELPEGGGEAVAVVREIASNREETLKAALR
jgi:hypothetical protein